MSKEENEFFTSFHELFQSHMDKSLTEGFPGPIQELFRSPGFISEKERTDPPFDAKKYVFAIVKKTYENYQLPYTVCFPFLTYLQQ